MIRPAQARAKPRRIRDPMAALRKPKPRLNPEALGARLYQPAYVTGLWRLNHEGFIPEGVTLPTFATPRETTTILTKIGPIEYHHIPRHAFFGFQKKKDGTAVARPEKALLDFLWLQNVEWTEKEFERWRLYDDWKRLNWDRLREYARKWREPRLERAVEALATYLG
jgi:hypothetical protein